MPKPAIVVDFEELCRKYGLPSALLVLPQKETEFIMFAHEVTETEFHNLGLLLRKHIQDPRGRLN